MSRYHITDDGTVRMCSAQRGSCPYGEEKHGLSPEHARLKYEQHVANDNDPATNTFGTFTKNSSGSLLQVTDEERAAIFEKEDRKVRELKKEADKIEQNLRSEIGFISISGDNFQRKLSLPLDSSDNRRGMYRNSRDQYFRKMEKVLNLQEELANVPVPDPAWQASPMGRQYMETIHFRREAREDKKVYELFKRSLVNCDKTIEKLVKNREKDDLVTRSKTRRALKKLVKNRAATIESLIKFNEQFFNKWGSTEQ